jgi:hypothetical protein
MLSPEEAGRFIGLAVAEKNRQEELLACLSDVSLDAEGLLCHKGQPVAGELSVERLLEAADLYTQIDFDRLQEKWAQEALLAGKQKGARLEMWQMLGRALDKVQQLKQQNMTQFFGLDFAYRGQRELNQALIQTLAEMAEAFDNGGLSWWNRLCHRDWLAVRQEFSIDGHGLESRRDCQLAMQYVALQQARNEAKVKWRQLLEPYGMVSYEELAAEGDDCDDLLSARWREVEGYLHFPENVWQELMLLWRQAGVYLERVYRPASFATPHGELKEQLRWLREDFPCWQEL